MSTTFFFTMEIILSIAIALLIVSGFVIWNLLRKNERGEDIIVYQQTYLNKVSDVVEFCNTELQKIDEKGAFKSDDEVGFFFKQLKDLQEVLNQVNINKL